MGKATRIIVSSIFVLATGCGGDPPLVMELSSKSETSIPESCMCLDDDAQPQVATDQQCGAFGSSCDPCGEHHTCFEGACVSAESVDRDPKFACQQYLDPGASEPRCPDACAAIMAEPGRLDSPEDLGQLLQRIRGELFKELEGVQISLEPMDRETDFFDANPDLTTFLKAPRQRRYVIHYNSELFSRAPPPAGVAAILVHELQHVVDYLSMSSGDLVQLGFKYLIKSFGDYEHAIDEHALRLGCGEGLAQFRQWLYTQLSAKEAAQKRQDYYTPEEIYAWIDQRCP